MGPQQPQAPLAQQPELAPGQPFATVAQPQQAEGSLIQMLTALSGLGLNVAGAATRAGAAGNQALSHAQQMGQQEESRVQQRFQQDRSASAQGSSEDIAKSLVPRLGELPANERESVKAMLRNREWERAQSAFSQNEARQERGKDDFARVKGAAEAEIREIEKRAPQEQGPVFDSLQAFLSKQTDLTGRSSEDIKRFSKGFLAEHNTAIAKKGGKQLTGAMAEGLVREALEYYDRKNTNWFSNVDPKEALANMKSELGPAGIDENDAAAKSATDRAKSLRDAVSRAATAKGAAKAKAMEALRVAVNGGEAAPTDDKRMPAKSAAPTAPPAPKGTTRMQTPTGGMVDVPNANVNNAILKGNYKKVGN